jgi:hypothetical protein
MDTQPIEIDGSYLEGKNEKNKTNLYDLAFFK